MRQSANMIATALGFECTDLQLSDKQVALAPEDVVLPVSGLKIARGTVAAAQWTFSGFAGDQEFLTITNEQSAVLGLGPGWRENHDEPPWRVEITGTPPIVATIGWPADVAPRDRERAPELVARDEHHPASRRRSARLRLGARLPGGRGRRRPRGVELDRHPPIGVKVGE